MFCISTLEPRKNFDGLIRAFAEARRRADFPHHLVIAGGKGWLYENIFAEVSAPGMGPFVHFLGFVDDADLPAPLQPRRSLRLSQPLRRLRHPRARGDGLRHAVLCTDTSSLPEITGDAASSHPHR